MAKHIWEDSFSCGINKQVRKDLQKAAKDVRQKKKGAPEMNQEILWVCERRPKKTGEWYTCWHIGVSKDKARVMDLAIEYYKELGVTWPWVRNDPSTGKLSRATFRFTQYLAIEMIKGQTIVPLVKKVNK